MKTTISKKFFSICFATIFTSLLFAEVELPNRDRAKDKAKFGVNDIVYIEELTLNSCSILPSIEIANRIKNGALIYPFYSFKNGEEKLIYSKKYKTMLSSKYQMSIANKKHSFDKYGKGQILASEIYGADKKEFDKNYKDYQQKLLTAIEKQSKEKDPKFSLKDINFNSDAYNIIYTNTIVALELFGYTKEYDEESGLFSKSIEDRLEWIGFDKYIKCENAFFDPKNFKEFYSLSK